MWFYYGRQFKGGLTFMPFQSFNRLICSSINTTSRKASSIPAEKFASYSVSSCYIYVLPARKTRDMRGSNTTKLFLISYLCLFLSPTSFFVKERRKISLLLVGLFPFLGKEKNFLSTDRRTKGGEKEAGFLRPFYG